MYKKYALFNICLMFSCASLAYGSSVCNAPQRQHAFIVGEVNAQSSGELLYCEYHINIKEADIKDTFDLTFAKEVANKELIEKASKVTLVEYIDTQGSLIAKKLLIYLTDMTQPISFQLDTRFNEKRIAYQSNDIWRIGFKSHDDEQVNYKEINASSFINDAGFDDLVKKQWETLSRDKSVNFPFLLIKNQRLVGLRAVKEKCKWQAPASSICFQIDVDNFLLRMFTGRLSLEYNSETRELLVFEGVVNILNDDKETPKARITYTHL